MHPMVNHVEMLYQPGQRDHAQALFETMGFGTFTIPGGPWLGVKIDRDGDLGADNVMYANEPTPAQRNFDAAFAQALENDANLANTLERYKRVRRKHPQYVFHFGASVPTREDWKQRVERLQEANRSHPLLKGLVEVDAYEPGVPNALGVLSQAFIYTDILSAGPGAICPVLFDLQWIPEFDMATMEQPAFPDMSTMV